MSFAPIAVRDRLRLSVPSLCLGGAWDAGGGKRRLLYGGRFRLTVRCR